MALDADQVARWVSDFRGAGARHSINSTRASLTVDGLVVGTLAVGELRFQRAHLNRATELLNSMTRDASMGFGPSAADAREFAHLVYTGP